MSATTAAWDEGNKPNRGCCSLSIQLMETAAQLIGQWLPPVSLTTFDKCRAQFTVQFYFNGVLISLNMLFAHA
ncbi:hypothetical protein PROFUN_04696 [Planoprotostelium fungivorum]|uniref:Uncharacterized protein n=1 Tax=Planoprotostelium fungivorum TaxID=1890364 RepID=A0A2P6NFU6_9EUKA|nr:hypothetical protein PROFUN_04696 [Planoprotostelium fungivorum]